MTDLIFLRPYWLVALPFLVALGVWVMRRPAALGAWRSAVDPELMAAMKQIGRAPDARVGSGALLPVLGAGFVALALAGPAVERRDAPSFRNLDGVVLAMDVSPSVTQGDALAHLQTAARILLNNIGSRPGALIVYAGDAYLAAPLTSDTRQLGLTVSLLEAGVVPDPGSRPNLALDRAAAILRDAQIVAGDIVVFTDGGGFGSLAPAVPAGLKEAGVRLWFVTADAPSAELQAIARETGGDGFAASQAAALSAAVAEERSARLAETNIALIARNDLGRWLLLPALICAALLFRRVK